ncbi:MAG TPA: DUF5615 family PIN-like protein [Candidatus Kapabacteria bacterium]|nr:DUF5615 family PIN-like protein [Candidatus Kapabacteria bacterium]
MIIVADENIERGLVERLQSDGHSVRWISEDCPSVNDEAVLSIAFKQAALLITDDKGFGELVFARLQPTVGVLLLRIPRFDFLKRANRVSEILTSNADSLLHHFSVATFTELRSRLTPN